jgi:hypothetical protein
VLNYVPPSKTLTAAVLKDLGFGGGPKRGPQASRAPHTTRPPGSEKGLNKFQIQESYDQRLHLVPDWLTPSQRTRTSWRNQLRYEIPGTGVPGNGFGDYAPVARKIKRQVYWLGEENSEQK